MRSIQMNEDEIKAMLARMDKTNKELECSVAKMCRDAAPHCYELRLKLDLLAKTSFANKNEAAYKALFEESDIE